jgi:hypothetical protein
MQLNNATFISDFVGVWSGQETIKELDKIRSVLGPSGDDETAYIQTYLEWYDLFVFEKKFLLNKSFLGMRMANCHTYLEWFTCLNHTLLLTDYCLKMKSR